MCYSLLQFVAVHTRVGHIAQGVAVSVSELQCVAVCCSTHLCWSTFPRRDANACSCVAAVCCSVLQCVAVCCSVLQCVAVCCSVLQCVAVCCSVLQCVALYCSMLKCVVEYCGALQGVAVCLSQCVAVCCSMLRCVLRCVAVFCMFQSIC